MTQVTPNAREAMEIALALAEKRRIDKLLANARYRAQYHARQKYAADCHEFILHVGNRYEGGWVTMSGSEAMTLNKIFRDEFYSKYRDGSSLRLRQYVDREFYDKVNRREEERTAFKKLKRRV